MPAASPSDRSSLPGVLGAPRVQTYLDACSGDEVRAFDLYAWNARVSVALMLPAHFAEVAMRNVVSEALTSVYGPDWPWDTTFTRSLPSPRGAHFNPQRNLRQVRENEPTTGKVIAELKFAFWVNMFTARHQTRIWDPHIAALLPDAPMRSGAKLRTRVYDDLNRIRVLRNRVAHHEPIFTRNLGDDLRRMLELVDMRSRSTGTWVRALEDVTLELGRRP